MVTTTIPVKVLDGHEARHVVDVNAVLDPGGIITRAIAGEDVDFMVLEGQGCSELAGMPGQVKALGPAGTRSPA
ncbi:MAG: hypothetical protein HYU36_17430 [Planctomycetes bacterium]|nr:hypothetical protein [Planctomycetota bacterium]